MVNSCAVVITRGKNKGKTCGSVNARCKHVSQPLVCEFCKMKFDRSTSYHRHVNTHKKLNDKVRISIKKKYDEVDTTPTNTNSNSNTTGTGTATVTANTTTIVTETTIPQIKDVYDKLVQLEQQNSALREEVEELKHKPVTNYIAVLGSDFYTDLISKLGKSDAINFLAEKCVQGSPLSVFQKLYLDDKNPEDYPVACKGRAHFRYLDDEKRVVDDQDGVNLGDVMTQKISDAMLLAANEIDRGSVYNMNHIKERLDQFDKKAMINELACITKNPNHPFFKE